MAQAQVAKGFVTPAEELLVDGIGRLKRRLVKLSDVKPRKLPIQPHPGKPQERFVYSDADVCIYGGAAGGGKTWGLIQTAALYSHVPGYNAVLFRRSMTDALKPGAIWSDSHRLYPLMGGKANESRFHWTFVEGSIIQLGHLQDRGAHFNWQGSQLAFMGFDEATHFTEEQFWYLTSRARSACGAPIRVRATCNPDPDSFVADLIAWWIDQETGFAIPERAGVKRFFIRVEGALEWGDTYDELLPLCPKGVFPRSFCFIPAHLDDNPSLSSTEYRSTLEALPPVERERLLKGNWKIRSGAGLIFNEAWFNVVEKAPTLVQVVRYWDKAGTQEAGDYTAGVKVGKGADGRFYILDVVTFRMEAPEREQIIKSVAEADGRAVPIWLEQEPGSGGKDSALATIRNLAGWRVYPDRVSGPKIARWGPLASQAFNGQVSVVRAHWNREFLAQLHNADGTERTRDDMADAASGAFNSIANAMTRGFA